MSLTLYLIIQIPLVTALFCLAAYQAWICYKHKKLFIETYTDKEMLLGTKVNQLPDHWTILDIVKAYDDYIIGYLRSQGELKQNKDE